jgi:hypothetical protein
VFGVDIGKGIKQGLAFRSGSEGELIGVFAFGRDVVIRYGREVSLDLVAFGIGCGLEAVCALEMGKHLSGSCIRLVLV